MAFECREIHGNRFEAPEHPPGAREGEVWRAEPRCSAAYEDPMPTSTLSVKIATMLIVAERYCSAVILYCLPKRHRRLFKL
jgi:hypothetical protein